MSIKQYINTLDNNTLFNLYFHHTYEKPNEDLWSKTIRTVNDKIKTGEIEKPVQNIVTSFTSALVDVLICRYYVSTTQETNAMDLF